MIVSVAIVLCTRSVAGQKSVIWTDTLKTVCMDTHRAGDCVYAKDLGLNFSGVVQTVCEFIFKDVLLHMESP